MSNGESDLVQRYRENYGLREDVALTEEMIQRHWNLERALTRQLLDSDPGNRAEVFAHCYTRLYQELSWLNTLSRPRSREEKLRDFTPWREALSPPPAKIYEIGSGNGELLKYLAEQGYDCTGSEITEERGERLLGDRAGSISWRVGDGVNLAKYESEGAYDAVISNQLLEHLHPDDVRNHLAGVHMILRPGGRYVLSTPHRLTGPHDVSKIFGRPIAEGMHLREYTYRELFRYLRAQGFRDVYQAGQWRRIQRLTGGSEKWVARLLLKLLTVGLLASEVLLHVVPRRFRRSVARLFRCIGAFSDNIFLVAVR